MHMIPHFPKFKTLELNDKSSFDRATANYSRSVCELSFPTLFIWKDYLRPKLTLINDNLCILNEPINEAPFFLEPIGRKKIMGTLNECLNHAGRISRASTQYTFAIHHNCFSISSLRNNFDYIYKIRNLIELKGRKLDGKRNHLKQFEKRYPNYKLKSLGKNNIKEAMNIFDNWFAEKKTGSKPSLATSDLAYKVEHQALSNTFKYFDELKLRGCGIYIEGVLKGFFVGSIINDKMVCGQFMYADTKIRSIFQILQRDGLKYLFSDYKYINMEDDLGLPGLRKSKLSYQPIRLEEKFDIKFV